MGQEQQEEAVVTEAKRLLNGHGPTLRRMKREPATAARLDVQLADCVLSLLEVLTAKDEELRSREELERQLWWPKQLLERAEKAEAELRSLREEMAQAASAWETAIADLSLPSPPGAPAATSPSEEVQQEHEK